MALTANCAAIAPGSSARRLFSGACPASAKAPVAMIRRSNPGDRSANPATTDASLVMSNPLSRRDRPVTSHPRSDRVRHSAAPMPPEDPTIRARLCAMRCSLSDGCAVRHAQGCRRCRSWRPAHGLSWGQDVAVCGPSPACGGGGRGWGAGQTNARGGRPPGSGGASGDQAAIQQQFDHSGAIGIVAMDPVVCRHFGWQTLIGGKKLG